MNAVLVKVVNLLKALWSKLPESIRRFAGKHRQLFLSIVIISAAIFVFIVLLLLRKPPQRKYEEAIAPLVKVQQLNKQDIQMVIAGYGTAEAKVEVEIVPQVSGKVVSINPQFKPGGLISAGQELFKIDPRDYELTVRQARAGVADATVKLDLEKAEADIALDEWQQLHPGTEPSSPLVLREPQIKQAEALLESAKASLATAQLSLERTSLTLPIDVRVVNESVDMGQYVMAGQSAGRAYGTGTIEIEVPLEDKELAWFDVPNERIASNGTNSSGGKTPVEVRAEFAGSIRTWAGYVARTTGQVDKTSRLVSVVVEVPKPMDGSASEKIALLPGVFVEVLIKGNVLKDGVAVPRDAIRNRNEVWVVRDGKLFVQELKVMRADKEFAYVAEGIKDGELIVISSLDVVVDGMSVRVEE